MDVTDDRGRFDDERLMRYALGLEPDAELEAALAGDGQLRARLEAVRTELGAVEQGLERIVPVPPDDYADLSAQRWAGLKPLLRTPAAHPSHRRSWLKVLAPVAAVALVLGVGVVAFERANIGGQSASTSARDATGEKTGPNAVEAPALAGGSGTAVAADTAADYGLIVVARAKAPSAGRQAFSVERVLKGEAGTTIVLQIVGGAAPQDALVILYLLPASDSADLQSRTPSPAPASYGTLMRFRWRQQPAVAQPLAPGTRPADVTLP